MKERKRNLIFWLRALSFCLTIGSLIWWVSADTNEPRWLFYPSLIVTAILSLVDRQAHYRRERTVAEYENLGRTPASYEQAAKDKEQKRFRLGAYRATIRVSLSEEAFLRQLRHRAKRLGFRDPEIQIEGDSRRILMKQAGLFENAANRAQPNMEFDVTRLNDMGEVDVCAWESVSSWIMSAIVAAWGCVGEVVCIIHKVPFWFQLLILLFIGFAFASVPINIRLQAKRALRDLHREETVLLAEDE